MNKIMNSIIRSSIGLAIMAIAVAFPFRWAIGWEALGIPNNGMGTMMTLVLLLAGVAAVIFGLYLLSPILWKILFFFVEGKVSSKKEHAEAEKQLRQEIVHYKKFFAW